MQALCLLAHTSPLLVANIIRNKLGPESLAIDPVDENTAQIIMFTDMKKVRQALDAKRHKKSIFIAVASALDAQQIKGAYPLDFTPGSLKFVPMQLCKFDTLFGMCADTNIKGQIVFRKKPLLNKIIDLKMSTNIISIGQTLLYDIAAKFKRKHLRKILVEWLILPAKTRPAFDVYLKTKEHKFKEVPKKLIKKLRIWQEFDKQNPLPYGKFLAEAKGKTNKEIVLIAEKHKIGTFDGITLVAWAK